MTNVEMLFAAPHRMHAQSADSDCALPAEESRSAADQQRPLPRHDDQRNNQHFSAHLRSRTQPHEQAETSARTREEHSDTPAETETLPDNPETETDPQDATFIEIFCSSPFLELVTDVMHSEGTALSTDAALPQERDMQTHILPQNAQHNASGGSSNTANTLSATALAAGHGILTTARNNAQLAEVPQPEGGTPAPAGPPAEPIATSPLTTENMPLPLTTENMPLPVATENMPLPVATDAADVDPAGPNTIPPMPPTPKADPTESQPSASATPASEAPDIRQEMASLADQMSQEQREKQQGNKRSPQSNAAELTSKVDVPEAQPLSQLSSQQAPIQTKAATSAAAPAEPSPDVPEQKMDIARFAEQFDRLALRTLRSNDQQIRIELEPASLGKLFLQCKEADGALQITIGVQGDTVRSLLMGQEAALRASLAEQGVQVGQFSVSCQDREERPSHPQTPETPTEFSTHRTDAEAEANTNETNQMPARHASPWGRNQWVA